MEVKRECMVMLLPTEDKKALILSYLTDKSLRYFPNEYWSNRDLSKRHLYILSDDKPQVDDWYYCFISGKVLQHKNNCSKAYYDSDKTKKIISSTDPSLGLPQPSPQFIQKYVELFNKGEVIEECLVDYYSKLGERFAGVVFTEKELNYEPKVDKQNYITITKVKESWSREEVIELLLKAIDICEEEVSRALIDKDKFIKENL
jgi:hypothetical protein